MATGGIYMQTKHRPQLCRSSAYAMPPCPSNPLAHSLVSAIRVMLAIESGNCVKCCLLVVHGQLWLGPGLLLLLVQVLVLVLLQWQRFKNRIFYFHCMLDVWVALHGTCLSAFFSSLLLSASLLFTVVFYISFSVLFFFCWVEQRFYSILLPNFSPGYGSDFNLWTCRCPHTHTSLPGTPPTCPDPLSDIHTWHYIHPSEATPVAIYSFSHTVAGSCCSCCCCLWLSFHFCMSRHGRRRSRLSGPSAGHGTCVWSAFKTNLNFSIIGSRGNCSSEFNFRSLMNYQKCFTYICISKMPCGHLHISTHTHTHRRMPYAICFCMSANNSKAEWCKFNDASIPAAFIFIHCLYHYEIITICLDFQMISLSSAFRKFRV